MTAPYPPGTAERHAIEARMAEPPVFDRYCRFLAGRGYEVPAEVLDRDVRLRYRGSSPVEDVLVAVYADDGPEAS